MPFPHEEHREIGSFWSWFIVVVFCIVIVAWGLLNWLLIREYAPPMGYRRDPGCP